MKKRLNPFDISDQPRAKEIANHNSLDAVERCPICDAQCQILMVNDIPTNVCIPHRISLPTKD